MFVLCEPPPNLHDAVDVYLPKGKAPVRIPGFVVHRHTHGIGMLFRDLDSSARAIIEKWLG